MAPQTVLYDVAQPADERARKAALRKQAFGADAGLVVIADDFDAPLRPEVQRFFEGEDDGPWGARETAAGYARMAVVDFARGLEGLADGDTGHSRGFPALEDLASTNGTALWASRPDRSRMDLASAGP